MATAALPSASSAANHTMLDEYIYGNQMENGSSGVAEDNGSPVLEDDMLLGAEAEHLDRERPKSFHQSLCKGKMTHMDSVSSDGSRYSIDQLLHDRKPDPEEMLRNLGFASSSKLESRRRVPVRFLQTPSRARGISLEQLVKTNSELNECVEASKEMMMPQGSGLHSFKTATKTVRMIARLSHMQKHKPQDNNIPKTTIEPMEVTSPDGNYKYMTILDPENSLYLAKQGHYKKLSRQSKFKFANAMPDILSPTVSQDEHQKLLHKVDKTLLKSEASICNDKDVKPKRLEFEGENIVAPLEIVEASKENVDSHLDVNSNLRPQPVTQLSWQPAGCLIRPMAQNCGAFTMQYLQHFSHQHNQSEDRNAELTDVDCDVANKRLDVSDVSSEIEADERTSTDQSKSYLSDNGVGERETSSGERSLKSTLFMGVGSGSPTGNLDQGDLDMTQQDARGGNSQHSDEGISVSKVGRKKPEAGNISTRPSEVGEKQWLSRRSNWRACPNFTIQVEPTEGEVVPEKPTNSFDMEEIQSADEDVVDDILPVFKRETSKGSLVRSGSGHSDSSGFTEFDEESEVTVCFARIPSKDSVKESYGDSSDSSCTVCGSLEHDGHNSLEHDRQSSMERDQESDQTLYTSPSSVAMQILNSASATSSGKTVTIATGDHHDNDDDVRNTAETQQLTAHESVESKDVISANVPSVYTSAEASTTSNHQLTLSSQPHSQQSVTVDDASPTTNTSSVTDPQSQTGPCHECQQKPVSSVMDTVSTCRDAEIDRVGLESDRKLMSHPANDQDAGAGIIFCSREMGTREEQTLATVVIHSHQQHLVEEVTKVQQQHLAGEVQQLQQQHVVEARQAQPQHMVEETSRAQPQHLVEEAKQVQQQHLVDEVKQVQQDVVRYKSSLQMLETQSTEIMSKHISEQFRDELCELQQLRSDIFQEVVKLEHLLAVRMRLVIAGNRVQLHASETNHRHIVLPMVDLLREQICHHNIIDALEQSMTQPPDSDDTVVDTTVDDTSQTPLPQSDDVVSYQMMFTQAMDGLKVVLLADIRSTIHSEMEPLRVQMQEFGDRLKRLESVVTNGEVVAPHVGTQHDNIDNGVT